MANYKKIKKSSKRKKKYPPLSKEDKFLYTLFEVVGAIILFVFVYLFESFTRFWAFKNSEVLAVEARWTVVLLLPVACFWLFIIFKTNYAKIPIIGNKKINYYNDRYKFILPLFDKRYLDNEEYKIGRKKFLRNFIAYFSVFIILLSVGFMGCVGRHEFTENGIVTYNIFNNKVEEYSYDEVESHSVNAFSYYRGRPRGLSYHTYDIHLVANVSDGTSFIASYGMSRDVYALEQLDVLLGDNKTVNSYYLQEFINSNNFTDDEIKSLYKLFDE